MEGSHELGQALFFVFFFFNLVMRVTELAGNHREQFHILVIMALCSPLRTGGLLGLSVPLSLGLPPYSLRRVGHSSLNTPSLQQWDPVCEGYKNLKDPVSLMFVVLRPPPKLGTREDRQS